MGISFIDKWLVAEGTNSSRRYVVHTQFPRFILEMCDNEDGGYESSHIEIYDECLDASLLARLGRQAGEVFRDYDKDLAEEQNGQ